MSFHAERRLGLPRPQGDLSRFQQQRTNKGSLHNNDNDNDSDDDGDDDYYGYNSEEEEERMLSKKHGEAQDAGSGAGSSNAVDNNGSNNKRKQTDQEIAAEYNNGTAASKKTKSSNSKPRRKTISETDLVQSNGLSVIATQFPVRFAPPKYTTTSSTTTATTTSTNSHRRRHDMTRFSRHLMEAYQQWANPIVPGTPWEEVLHRLPTLQSKTSVKRFVQTMRDQVRNQHVERIYGLQAAEQMIAQLEMAVEQEQEHSTDSHPMEPDEDMEELARMMDDVEEAELAGREPVAVPTTMVNPVVTPTHTPAAAAKGNRHVLEDSGDEEDFTVNNNDNQDTWQVSARITTPEITSTPASRRAVLEDSSDEDDGEALFEFELEIEAPTAEKGILENTAELEIEASVPLDETEEGKLDKPPPPPPAAAAVTDELEAIVHGDKQGCVPDVSNTNTIDATHKADSYKENDTSHKAPPPPPASPSQDNLFEAENQQVRSRNVVVDSKEEEQLSSSDEEEFEFETQEKTAVLPTATRTDGRVSTQVSNSPTHHKPSPGATRDVSSTTSASSEVEMDTVRDNDGRLAIDLNTTESTDGASSP